MLLYVLYIAVMLVSYAYRLLYACVLRSVASMIAFYYERFAHRCCDVICALPFFVRSRRVVYECVILQCAPVEHSALKTMVNFLVQYLLELKAVVKLSII